jgi:putative MATE family efflux protein
MNQAERASFNTEYWRFLVSSILIALSGCLGNVVDAIIVGNLINEDAVSAINLSKPVIQFMFTLNMLVGTGAAILVGIEIGKKNMRRAAYIYTLSITSCLVIGLMLTACGFFIPDIVTGWLCDNEELFQPTYDYLRVMLLGAPAYMIMWGINMMVGVDGSPRLVSIAIMADNAVNLCCDIVFIKLLGWGIEGSSTATVVGHLVGIVIMFRHYMYKDNHLVLVFKDKTFNVVKDMYEIISQGAPLAIASVCLTLLLFSANNIVLSSLGRTGIFAFAVCMNLLQIYNLFLSGVCRTIQSLGSIQVGKGDNEAFRLVITKSLTFITVAMILICIVVWFDPSVISRLFGANDSTILAESNHALRIFSLSFIPFCYIYAIMIVYKLYAHHRMALFISFALSLTVIPVLWLVSMFAPNLLWYSYLVAYIIEIVAIVVLHHVMHAKFELPSFSTMSKTKTD